METRRGRPRRSTADYVVAETPAPKTPRTETTRSKMAAKSTPLSVSTIIAIGMTTSMVFMAISAFAYQKNHTQHFKIPRFNNIGDRLTFTLQWNAFSMLPMVMSLVQVLTVRVNTAAVDPTSGNEHLVEYGTRILTNTFEQTFLNIVNQLIMISWLPTDQMHVIPLMVLFFVFGRIAFFIGYNIAPRYRTFGFMITFFPTMVMFSANMMFAFGFGNRLPAFFTGSIAAAARPAH